MKQVVLEQPGRFVVSETAHPGKPKEGEALVKVRRLGVCGTDLHAFRGKQPFFTYPRRLGHELGVEVVEVGPKVTELGRRPLLRRAVPHLRQVHRVPERQDQLLHGAQVPRRPHRRRHV